MKTISNADRVMNFIKINKRIKAAMTIEECHLVSDLFKHFMPAIISYETSEERLVKLDQLANEILDEYSFLDCDMGYEYLNGLLGSLSYNLFQFLAGNFVKDEAWRLENISSEVNQSFLDWVNN